MLMAAAGFALTPVDFLMRPFEKRRYTQAPASNKPTILVVGPPRSGTTLVAQYLINSFEVGYLNNLTSLFPKSPIQANRLFGKFAPLAKGDYSSYYGKSRRLSGANDGLYIWDRWLGADRGTMPNELRANAAQDIPQFFAALQNLYELPIVNKVNRLNTCANLISDVMGNVFFVCLHREPIYLAQSLYIARQEILGQLGNAYGTRHPDSVMEDPVEDVCRQVVFHQRMQQKQQALLGEERYSIVSYEDFCERPADFANTLSRQHPQLRFAQDEPGQDTVFRVSRTKKLPDEIFGQLQERLTELGEPGFSLRRF